VQKAAITMTMRRQGRFNGGIAIRSKNEVICVIFDRLRALIAEQFSVSEESIDMDTSFTDDLGADSLDVVELTMAIEEEFDIPETDEEVLYKLVTVGDVFRYISSKID
jgi:acyl carrier protein